MRDENITWNFSSIWERRAARRSLSDPVRIEGLSKCWNDEVKEELKNTLTKLKTGKLEVLIEWQQSIWVWEEARAVSGWLECIKCTWTLEEFQWTGGCHAEFSQFRVVWLRYNQNKSYIKHKLAFPRIVRTFLLCTTFRCKMNSHECELRPVWQHRLPGSR